MAASEPKLCQCPINCIVVGALSCIIYSALPMLNIEFTWTSINLVNVS